MDKRPRLTSDGLDGRSKRLFDASVEEIDAATLARLRAARERALRELTGWAWLKAPRAWVPAAAAAALVVALAPQLVERGAPQPARDFGAVTATDLEILLSDEALEMLADLEFYEWLELENVLTPDRETEDGVG
ncbi:MAG TPA: hypothetical protein VLD39_14850 [Gammaproteobacteria bacterium]|nr:hypothetical protein [Gammaproteobacteria bacterium]